MPELSLTRKKGRTKRNNKEEYLTERKKEIVIANNMYIREKGVGVINEYYSTHPCPRILRLEQFYAVI